MYYSYDNTFDLGAGYYAEISSNFTLDPNDWTIFDLQTLVLWFYGHPINDAGHTEQMYVALEDGDGNYSEVRYGRACEDMNDIKMEEWQSWCIELEDFNGVDLARLEKLYLGFGERGSTMPGGGGVMCFDDIRLSTISTKPPAIADLSASPGPGASEVMLTWSTPLIESPASDQSMACSYEFRYSDAYIDDSTWDTASVVVGDIPPVGIYIPSGIQLDLDAQYVEDRGKIWMDQIHMRAWVTVWIHGVGNFPTGYPVCDAYVYFQVKDENGYIVYNDVVQTGSWDSLDAGQAESVTGDLCEEPLCDWPEGQPYPIFHCKAWLPRSTLELGNGMCITPSQDVEDTENIPVCEGFGEVPSAGDWSWAGGVYDDNLADVNYTFHVQPGALPGYNDVEVVLSSPVSVPSPYGMNRGVPGPMVAFELQKMDDPNLDKPIVISVDYPAEKLDQYGGLGESSLRPYRYNDTEQRWKLLDETSFSVNCEVHQIAFRTNELGLFAIAAETDADGDGLGDYEELRWGTNPGITDSDGDGISDGNEIWFTLSDPQDARKKDADDQYAIARNLETGQGYYIAGRIIGECGQSAVSNCVYIANPCQENVDINCDTIVNFKDLAIMAENWLATVP
jgi:hypothetical protein